MKFQLKQSAEFEKAFEDLIKKDKPLAKKITKKLRQLIDNPTLGKPLKYDLSGRRSLRIGKYRVVYRIEGNTIYLITVKHREKSYK